MPQIRQLTSHVANLIAAGEVVERPASVVKELVENAIDAGAGAIVVEIQNGGMTFIRVSDDGCGMQPQDAKPAFLRHATSKIWEASDLATIATLGFRGEALAAIAAVSRIDLLTRPAAIAVGTALHLEAGELVEETEAGCPSGTTILVRDLFFNTPARMKFMKRDTMESAAVFAAVQKQALSHPEVSIRFIKDGEEHLHTTGDGELSAAIYQIFGRQFAMELVPVDGKWGALSVCGFVTKPTATRGNRSYQHFFVNGRCIRSRLLSSALEEAYHNQMISGRFPSCVLMLTLPTNALDINVHPAKIEAKFLSEKDVFDGVHYAVQAALEKTPARPEMSLSERPVTGKKGFYRTMTAQDYRKLAETIQDAPAVTAAPAVAKAILSPKPQEPAFVTAVPPVPEHAGAVAEVRSPVAVPEPELVQQAIPLTERPYRVVGEVFDTYFIVEQGSDLVLIDKHAAHERILFEALRSQEHPVMSQMLLTPISASLTAEDAAAALAHAEFLREFGFEVEDFGDGAVLIRQIPSELSLDDAEATLAALAAELLSGRHLDPTTLRDRLFHTIACKAAIKSGYCTRPEERDALILQVMSREELKYCPHGRPICVVLTDKQLEKQFKRS